MCCEKPLQITVKNFIDSLLLEAGSNPECNDSLTQIQYVLQRIIEAYHTYTYHFNLAMDILVESQHIQVADLQTILDAYAPTQKGLQQDIVFAAFYTLSLILKKEENVDDLKTLTDDPKFHSLGGHPLYFEVMARYAKRNGRFADALESDQLAIDMLQDCNYPPNAAVGASYASTVCTMLMQCNSKVKPKHIDQATKYIEDAISTNENYPKYYFLKARLLFLSALFEEKNLEELETISETAFALIHKARLKLIRFYENNGKYTQRETAKYDEFARYITEMLDRKQNPKFNVPDDALEILRKVILSKNSRTECNGHLPPLPRLDKNDKYFFICYRSLDFKSVFSDLIALYKRKVPFRYDENLNAGDDWDIQVKQYISDPNCQGVVFYLSKQSLASDPIIDEINITKECKKPYFCVNLEGSKEPSLMLIENLIESYDSNPRTFKVDTDKLLLLLRFFSDNMVYTAKTDPAGTEHIDVLVKNIMTKFPDLIIGE